MIQNVIKDWKKVKKKWKAKQLIRDALNMWYQSLNP